MFLTAEGKLNVRYRGNQHSGHKTQNNKQTKRTKNFFSPEASILTKSAELEPKCPEKRNINT